MKERSTKYERRRREVWASLETSHTFILFDFPDFY